MLFLIFQFLCYFSGIAFSTGGGNSPEQTSTNFIYLKAAFIAVPVFTYLFKTIIAPKKLIHCSLLVIKNNIYLILYFLVGLLLIPLAVNWEYSLIRLSYTLFQFISLFCLISQFYLITDQQKFCRLVIRSINNLAIISLILPCYILIKNGFSIFNFRAELQAVNLIHPNILASFYALMLIWCFFQVFCYKNKSRLIWILIPAIIFFEALLFSRTALIALTGSFILLPFLTAYFQKSKFAILVSAISIVFFMIAFGLITTHIVAIGDLISVLIRKDTIDSLLTLTNRTVLWTELLKDMDTKVFMAGYGYSVISENYGVDLGTGILYGAHNAYLSVLLGTGIFSLVFYLCYLFKNLRWFLHNKTFIGYPSLYLLLSSYFTFLFVGLSSEEVGVNLSINFSYLIFITNVFFNFGRVKMT